MRPPIYSPPYASPIENDFAWHIVKYLDESVSLLNQYPVETICGLFIVDFVAVTSEGRRVGFECDGKEFHLESTPNFQPC